MSLVWTSERFPVTCLPERSKEDALATIRTRAMGHLEKAWSEWIGGVFMVPSSVQNRIKKVGDAVHTKIESVDESTISSLLQTWLESTFSGRSFGSLGSEDFKRIIEKILSLWAINRQKLERRFPQIHGWGPGFLGCSSYGECVMLAVPLILEGIRTRKTVLLEQFENPKDPLFFDKTLD